MAANSICWKLPSKFTFFSHKHNKKIDVQPYIVEFRRFLTCSSVGFQEVTNTELLHSIVGLYDVCLPDITPEVLYPTVCAKWAKTIILVRSQSDVISELKEKYGGDASNKEDKTADDEVVPSFLNEKNNEIFLTEKHVRWEDEDYEDQKGTDNGNDKQNEEESDHSQESENSDEDEETSDMDENSKTSKKRPDENIIDKTDIRDSAKKAVSDMDVSDSGVSLDKPPKDKEEETEPGKFDGVFSDSEEEEEEEEEEDEEDFSAGVDEYIAAARERKIQLHQGNVTKLTMGIESTLIGAATYERCYSNPREKVMQLSLLSIRKRYRKCGIGKRLIDTIKDPTIMGPYDSIAVFADNDAVDFFTKNGFTDDVVLNSRFTELTDHWINSTLMCYLPPFTGSDITGVFRSEFEMKAMEDEMDKWREKSLEAYQAQMSCMVRMKHEIKTLKAMVDTQDEVIKTLTSAKERILKDKYKLEKQLLDYRVKEKNSGWTFEEDSEEDDDFYESLASILSKQQTDGEREHELDLEAISQGHFTDVSKEDEKMLATLIHSQTEKHIMQQVRRSLMASRLYSDVNILNISQVESSHVALLETMLENPAGSSRVSDVACQQLYYCGASSEDSLNVVIKRGFTKQDFMTGLYGKGLYFTTQPSQAVRFSVPGKLLLVKVRLGTTDITSRQDRTRVLPAAGFDSILTPGRPTSPSPTMIHSQEYVIFDPLQAVPAYLIEYSTTKR